MKRPTDRSTRSETTMRNRGECDEVRLVAPCVREVVAVGRAGRRAA
jgi:hypothetical protein